MAPPLADFDQNRSPALADMIDTRRVRTAVMIYSVVDPPQVDRGRPEIGVPGLALDDGQMEGPPERAFPWIA